MEEHLSEFAENASANAPEDGQANSVIRRLSVLLDQTTWIVSMVENQLEWQVIAAAHAQLDLLEIIVKLFHSVQQDLEDKHVKMKVCQ